MQEQEVGRIIHFYTNISVGIIQLSSTLKVGDMIHVKGATTDFTQKVASMQVSHQQVTAANPGESIGLKVRDHVREHDVVYKVTGGQVAVSMKPQMPAKAPAKKPTKAKKKPVKRTRAKKKAAPARKAAKRAKKQKKGKTKRRKKRTTQRKARRKR